MLVWFCRHEAFILELWLALAVPQLVMSFVGVYLLAGSGDETLRHVLGVSHLMMTLAFGGVQLYEQFRSQHSSGAPATVSVGASPPYIDPLTGRLRQAVLAGAMIAGTASGIFGSMVGVGGPPVMIFFMFFQLPPTIVRSNFPASVMPSSWVHMG
jgi:uncharacterized membrane protein YfcA